jgi:hypothetical protein
MKMTNRNGTGFRIKDKQNVLSFITPSNIFDTYLDILDATPFSLQHYCMYFFKLCISETVHLSSASALKHTDGSRLLSKLAFGYQRVNSN